MNPPTITIRIEPKVIEIMNSLVQNGVFKNKSTIREDNNSQKLLQETNF